jgi:hypothetical protein
MKLKIKVSDLMDASKSPLVFIEDRLIRIPKGLREQLGLELGSFLTLKGTSSVVYLQVYQAYTEDVSKEEGCVFVSQNTWDLLDIAHLNRVLAAEEILIGCDPEMFIMDRGAKMVTSAAHFFHHYGEIGNDNGLLELRPRPSINPKEVTETIRGLINQAAMRIKNRTIFKNRDLFLMAASNVNGTSAGFHVHFGLPSYILKQDAERVWILTNMVTILDYYVGVLSILPEGDTDAARRSQKFTRYGKPGDFRADDNLTFEYRVAGGHLLKHPVYTEGLLTISKLVMGDILSRLEKMSNKDKTKMYFTKYDDLRKAIYPNLPERLEVYETLTAEKINRALGHVEKLANDYSKMIGFDKHKEVIEKYLSLALSAAGDRTKISDNLEENWRVSDENRHQQVAVL